MTPPAHLPLSRAAFSKAVEMQSDYFVSQGCEVPVLESLSGEPGQGQCRVVGLLRWVPGDTIPPGPVFALKVSDWDLLPTIFPGDFVVFVPASVQCDCRYVVSIERGHNHVRCWEAGPDHDTMILGRVVGKVVGIASRR